MAQNEYSSTVEGRRSSPLDGAPIDTRRLAALLHRLSQAVPRRRRAPQLTNEEHHRLRLAEQERQDRQYTALLMLLGTTFGSLR